MRRIRSPIPCCVLVALLVLQSGCYTVANIRANADRRLVVQWTEAADEVDETTATEQSSDGLVTIRSGYGIRVTLADGGATVLAEEEHVWPMPRWHHQRSLTLDGPGGLHLQGNGVLVIQNEDNRYRLSFEHFDRAEVYRGSRIRSRAGRAVLIAGLIVLGVGALVGIGVGASIAGAADAIGSAF